MPEVLDKAPVAVLERTLDARRLNEIANHPDVRPWLGGEGTLDLSAMAGSIDNFAFETEGGGFLAARIDVGLYEVHSLFLPTARRQSLACAIAGLDYMFTRTDCIELVTRLPEGNAAAAALARLGGFTKRFRREGVWDGKAVDFASLTIQDWALASPACTDAGRKFHDALGEAKTHADDPVHDAMAGAAALMVGRGNVFKGANVYNRWAVVAGYQPVSVVSTNPVVVDIADAVLEVRDGEMRVLLCR